jgi:hypothetical protein
MRVKRTISYGEAPSFGERVDAMLLGRLGSELALIYHDTLQAPLPAGLRALVERLDAAALQRPSSGANDDRNGSR